MRAALLSIGDELALGQALDTNSAWLARELAARSILTDEHRTMMDDRVALAAAIRDLTARYDLLVITGGLGPTEDDLTREALGDVLTPDRPLVADTDALAGLERWFAEHRIPMPETNRSQAQRPEIMRMLPNSHGTAPGLAGRHQECLVYALPGPPREMKPMFTDHVAPDLPESVDGEVLRTINVHEYGLGEASAAERLGALTERDRKILVGTTASEAIISARIRVLGAPGKAENALEETASRVEEAWQPYCYGRDDASLSSVVGGLLGEAGKTLTTAESCTGGWLGKTVVDEAGSSAYYRGGWVTYSDKLKASCLGVPLGMLQTFGAVSEEVAEAMARGALKAAGADFALSTTGIAGPDGGTDAKPVGTVFIALARKDREGSSASVRRFRFTRGRTAVRDRTVKSALQILRFSLLGVSDDMPLLWQVPR
ncbi:MAG: CinA family nicotinamide mononucleotide deamidase-related protein [Phycisphaerales bacterium]|nr:MAG: CinA family nicotinamide mononucleotide deamidase-related protein [Phycisphaerales bacterium]